MIKKDDIQNILSTQGLEVWGVVTESKPKSLERFKAWIKDGLHGALGYLADDRAIKREDLKNYYPDIKSTLVIAFDYSHIARSAKKFYESGESNGLKIANYVVGFKGRDYHYEVRDKLQAIGIELQKLDPELDFKFSLDTQPILERDFAYQSGLGWYGKNSMLINRHIGSYFIIGSLLLNKEVEAPSDKFETDHCGQCTRCGDACPTAAIDIEKRTIIADKCISTFTIEHFKEVFPPSGIENANGEIFGCDICQDVCPWNKRLERKLEADSTAFKENGKQFIDFFLMRPLEDIFCDLEEMSNREYRRIFKGTPLERTGRVGMLKNLRHYLSLK